MNTTELPFGTQFSPEQVNLRRLLELAQEYTGKANRDLVRQIASEFFAQKNEAEKLAGNTSISLKGYGLLEGKTTIRITETGKMLLSLEDENQLKKAFAKHILLNLNGLVLVDTLRRMELSGEKLTNASINEELIRQGFKLKQTSNNAQVMKLWLNQGEVILDGWKVNETVLKDLLGIEGEDIANYKGLQPQQYYFLLALCNAYDNAPLLTTDIRELAAASYAMTTGHLTSEAKKYARRIMEDMNLCILMLQKEDIDSIIENPPCIVDIFNRQSQEAKKIKVLPNG